MSSDLCNVLRSCVCVCLCHAGHTLIVSHTQSSQLQDALQSESTPFPVNRTEVACHMRFRRIPHLVTESPTWVRLNCNLARHLVLHCNQWHQTAINDKLAALPQATSALSFSALAQSHQHPPQDLVAAVLLLLMMMTWALPPAYLRPCRHHCRCRCCCHRHHLLLHHLQQPVRDIRAQSTEIQSARTESHT